MKDILRAGAPLADARAAVVCLHGRGAGAEDILGLASNFAEPAVAYLAPQAPGNQWYPNRFMAPIESNEPLLSSSLATVGALVEEVGDRPLVLLGFSQGACLALEYGARNPRRYGGFVGLSGGLIGPPGTSWSGAGSLDGTPVFLGCSDVDFHIPKERVEESARALSAMGADVTMRLYPGMGHTVNEDEVEWIRELLRGLAP